MTEPTFCAKCDHVHESTRKLPWHSWRCSQFRVLLGANFVDPGWLPDPPFGLCREINRGLCPVFAPRRAPAENGAAARGEMERMTP